MRYGQPLTEREQTYAQRWLGRHGAAGREAPPLLAARLAARYRAGWIEAVVVGVALVFLLGHSSWDLATRDWAEQARGEGTRQPADSGLAIFMIVYAVMSVGVLLALRYRRRADRRIGRALPHRVARSSAVDLRQLLGGWFLAAAAVIYGGALLVGGLGLAFGSSPDQAEAAVFLVATLVFGSFGVAILVDVARRPAVAEDEATLVDDHVLRREDGHRALTPFLVPFALVAAVHSSSGDGLLAAYLGYAVLSGIVLIVAVVLASQTRTGTAGVAADVQP